MAEHIANLGYLAIAKETGVKGVPVATPSIYIPLYSETIGVKQNNILDNPIVGQKFESYQVLPGLRDYQGTLDIMAEPNTVAYIFDMLLTKGTPTGSGPYTYPFSLSPTTNPNSYTMDIGKGNVVWRFMGVEASQVKPKFDKNEMHYEVKISALKTFVNRTVATIVSNVLTLSTAFTSTPTAGLIVGDLIQVSSPTGAYANFNTTVSAISGDGITVTLAAVPGALAVGDFINLRPATAPSYTTLTPFLWSNTQFCFAATAASALTATQTPLETGSEYTLMHKFKDDSGEHRSGNQEPVSLVRTLGNAQLKVKKFFDTINDQNDFQNVNGKALVVRHYSGSNYELRVTFNDIRIDSGVEPALKIGEVLYSDMVMTPVYNKTDGQAISVTVINNLSSI